MHDDGHAAGSSLDGDLGQGLALLDGHDGAGAVRTTHEQAVHAVAQVVDVISKLLNIDFALGSEGSNDCGVNTGKFLDIHDTVLLFVNFL